jgi:hypothetical protein
MENENNESLSKFRETIKNLFNQLHDRIAILETRADRLDHFLHGHTSRIISELDDLKNKIDK